MHGGDAGRDAPDLGGDRFGGRRLAGYGQRFLGLIIDGLLLLLAGIPLEQLGNTDLGIVLALSVSCAYHVLTVGLRGQTVGQQFVRARVVTVASGGVPGVDRAVVRWATISLPSLLLVLDPGETLTLLLGVWTFVVYLPMFWSAGRQGLHDRAAGVYVLDDRIPDQRPEPG